jgi:hypothetical protein
MVDKLEKAAKEKCAEIMKKEANLDLFAEGYKNGFVDGYKAACQQLELTYAKQMEDDGTQPIYWPRFP